MPEYKVQYRERDGAKLQTTKLIAPCAGDAEDEVKRLIDENDGGEIRAVVRADEPLPTS